MIAQKRSLKKITIATGIVAMSIGVLSSLNARADEGSGASDEDCTKYCTYDPDYRCVIGYPSGNYLTCVTKRVKPEYK